LAGDCASPTWGRIEKNASRVSADCAKTNDFSAGRFRVTAAPRGIEALVAPAGQALLAAFPEIELRLRTAARRSAGDLEPFRILEQIARDTARGRRDGPPG